MLTVVAGILRDGTGRILVTERTPGKHLAGTWEFPGGKCEPAESPHQALARELNEELGIRVTESNPLLSLTHSYPERTVRLLIREIGSWQGEVRGLEGQAIRWADPDDLRTLHMPAADRPMVKALMLEPYYVITPPAHTLGGPDGVGDWTERVLAGGCRLLQVRAPGLDNQALLDLAAGISPLAARYRARWLLNGSPEMAARAGADGVHLNARRLRALRQRPLPEHQLVIASCHDAEELVHAGAIGADFVTVSPVKSTASHPQARPLGWDGLARLCAVSPLPVFALGGLSPDDLDRARASGAFGVAGIRGFAR